VFTWWALPPSVTRVRRRRVVIQANGGKKYGHPELVSGSHESRVMSLWSEILNQVQDDRKRLTFLDYFVALWAPRNDGFLSPCNNAAWCGDDNSKF
jgi:hypothetical protein